MSQSSVEECPLHKFNHNCQKKPKSLKGPARVIKLCLLGILAPFLLTTIPLYLRFRVYGSQLYPLAMSDMRLLDNKVSTTWCQRQIVRVQNATFNAFLLSQPPTLSAAIKPLTMVRHLVLEDDTKEYWGFYLLSGSSVTVSTCVRWPGASLIVIRGHKHLHECAYIGDDSSEELNELIEAIREKNEHNSTIISRIQKNDTAPVNEPDLMKRHRIDVEFHHPIHQINYTSMDRNNKHTIDDRKNKNAINGYYSSEVTDTQMMQTLLKALKAKTQNRKNYHVAAAVNPNKSQQQDKTGDGALTVLTRSQEETVDEIVRKLHDLGDDRTVLDQINRRFAINKNGKMIDDEERIIEGKSKGLNDNKSDLVARKRRQIELSNSNDALVKDDIENDLGMEEGLSPDGIADHRGTVNETTLNDYSNSEFWSSFSSSEEALLNCDGLILNLPLTPHHKCSIDLNAEQAEETYLANTITYKVPVNGYYFFVFNSENEVQPNYLRVQFDLNKAMYNVSNPVANCTNESSTCSMNLRFFSSEKLVLELPMIRSGINDSLWNEEFVVLSECEPRTVLYALCVIAVPILVILFAFS